MNGFWKHPIPSGLLVLLVGTWLLSHWKNLLDWISEVFGSIAAAASKLLALSFTVPVWLLIPLAVAAYVAIRKFNERTEEVIRQRDAAQSRLREIEERNAKALAATEGVSDLETRILEHLVRLDGQSTNPLEISRSIRQSRLVIAQQLEHLERKNLVKVGDGVDGVYVILTREGRDFMLPPM